MKRLLLLVLLISSTYQLYAQNRVCLPRLADNSSFGFPATEVDSFLQLSKYKAVFFGEQHNGRIDPQIKYDLITHLHKTYGYRHVFLEMGYSAAWIYNHYITTGDTSVFQFPGAYHQFWEKLYAYNKDLPANRQIILHGLDFERTGVFKVIRELAPKDKALPTTLQPAMDTVKAHLNDEPLTMYTQYNGKMTLSDHSDFEATLRWLQAQFSTHATEAQEYFGSNYKVLEVIVQNQSPVEVRPFRRNRTMFRNMKRTVEQEKIDKFVGFFGGMHTGYQYGSSLPNAAKRLPHVSRKDVLNIKELVYNKRDDGGQLYKTKNLDELKALNGACRATLLKSSDVPGNKRNADYVLIADYE